jgi:hypothetical protein
VGDALHGLGGPILGGSLAILGTIILLALSPCLNWLSWAVLWLAYGIPGASMKYGMSAPMWSGRGQWVIVVWRGSLSRRHADNQMRCYGDSKLEAIDRAMRLRRCLR